MKNLKSEDIVYSEHGEDECYEYKNGTGRVPDGVAVGYDTLNQGVGTLALFDDVKYSAYDHDYWDYFELEHDIERVVVG